MDKPRKFLAVRLLKVIFSLYLLVTVVVTVVQMVAEYADVKEQVAKDIIDLQNLFYPAFATALWNYDNRQMQAIISGMVEIDVVKGIKIIDTTQNELEMGAIGLVESDKQGWEMVNADGERQAVSNPLFQVDTYSNKIYFDSDSLGHMEIGELRLYSDSAVVIEKIKYGVILILINSIIKTCALWFIFLYFIHRQVGKPLQAITKLLRLKSIDEKDETLLKSTAAHNDELGNLCQSALDSEVVPKSPQN